MTLFFWLTSRFFLKKYLLPTCNLLTLDWTFFRVGLVGCLLRNLYDIEGYRLSCVMSWMMSVSIFVKEIFITDWITEQRIKNNRRKRDFFFFDNSCEKFIINKLQYTGNCWIKKKICRINEMMCDLLKTKKRTLHTRSPNLQKKVERKRGKV